MSGGHFEYRQYHLDYMADEIDEVIIKNDSVEINEWGDRVSHDLPPDILEHCKIAANLLRKAQVYVQRIDWLLEGDDGEDSFRSRLSHDLGLLRPYDVALPDDGITRMDAKTALDMLDKPGEPNQALKDIFKLS